MAKLNLQWKRTNRPYGSDHAQSEGACSARVMPVGSGRRFEWSVWAGTQMARGELASRSGAKHKAEEAVEKCNALVAAARAKYG